MWKQTLRIGKEGGGEETWHLWKWDGTADASLELQSDTRCRNLEGFTSLVPAYLVRSLGA